VSTALETQIHVGGRRVPWLGSRRPLYYAGVRDASSSKRAVGRSLLIEEERLAHLPAV